MLYADVEDFSPQPIKVSSAIHTCMKTPLLTVCTLMALASFANAQQTTSNPDPKKAAPSAQAPVTSGTSNSGDVDRSVPQTDHGTQKTPASSNGSAADPSSKPSDNGATKPTANKSDTTDKDHSKVTDRDHGVTKTTNSDPKDGTDPTKDARTEDKSKNDKITDHEHGAEKTKN